MRKRYRRGLIDGSLLVKMRELRKNPTEAERKLWYHLRRRNLGYRFQRSHTIEGFIADFRCHERRLVVEVDGGQHPTTSPTMKGEARRWVKDGYRVIRLWNTDVLTNPDGVLEAIGSALEKDPAPPP
jgi:very-short-patch-repair endonuclease